MCVDFDGTIRKDGMFMPGEITNDPLPGAKEALAKLTEQYQVAIFTTRVSPHWKREDVIARKAEIKKWLAKHGFEKGVHYQRIVGVKIPAVAYIDDRGIRFNDWASVMELLPTLYVDQQ